MENEFIPYEFALIMKQLGFDEPCYEAYTFTGGGESTVPPEKYNHRQDAVAAPLYQQAFRWFREKHGLHSYIEGAYPWFRYYINSEDNRYEGHKLLIYEEAELECLKKLIEIVKGGNNE